MSRRNSLQVPIATLDDDSDIQETGSSWGAKKRKISAGGVARDSTLTKLPRLDHPRLSGASQTKKPSGRSSLSAALSSASRPQPISTTSALKTALSLSSSSGPKVTSSASNAAAGPSRAAPRSNGFASSSKSKLPTGISDDDDLPDPFTFFSSPSPKKPIIPKGKQPNNVPGASKKVERPNAPRASTGHFAPTSKPHANTQRRQTISGGLSVSEAIEISSSDEEPVKKEVQTIEITDSDDNMDLDPPISPKPTPLVSSTKPASLPRAPVPLSITQSSSASRLVAQSSVATQKSTLPKVKPAADRVGGPPVTQPPGPKTLPNVQPTGTASQPGPSRGIDRLREHAAAQSQFNAARSSIGSFPHSTKPSSAASGSTSNKLSKPAQNPAKEMVLLGLDTQLRSESRPSQKGKVPATAPSKQASPKRPLFHPPTPPKSNFIDELTQNFEALASPSDRIAEVPQVSDSPERETNPAPGKESPKITKTSTSPGKHRQTARKSAYRSTAFVPKPSRQSPSTEELSTSSTVASRSTKTTVKTVPIPGSVKRERTVETTVVQKTTTKTTDETDDATDDEFFKTTTHASRSPSPALLRRPTSPKRLKSEENAKGRPVTSYTQETSHRSKVVVEKDVSGSKVVSTVEDEESKTSVQRRANPRRKARPKAVITSLKQQTVDSGRRWRNPFYDEPRKAMPLNSSLADSMNQTIPGFAEDPARRAIFEEMIRTRDRGAPPITIVNDVDNEPCPPFEFDWTNEMLFGENVPRKDKDLKGCDCLGPCDPYSKTCACIVRQNHWLGDIGEGGFAYGPDGQIMFCHAAVFECNEACGCSEDCQNRVVQNGRKCKLLLKKTRNKGWGVFADEFIPTGRFIGIYSGELLTDAEAHKRGLLGRTYLFNLDFVHLKDDTSPEKSSGSRESSASGNSKYAVDAFHAGNHTRFLNHSCDPNIELYPIYTDDADLEKPLLCAFTCKNVQRGEELCFSYHSEEGEGDSPQRDFSGEEAIVRGRCLCGAANCKGYMFRYSNVEDDEEDQQEETEDASDAMDI
ncbi:hypothetical protein FRC04_004450 [Tulasnella sp. 424]|nr:hypothetical protein FRC04_004450 [Tulasnella sp. 424]